MQSHHLYPLKPEGCANIKISRLYRNKTYSGCGIIAILEWDNFKMPELFIGILLIVQL